MIYKVFSQEDLNAEVTVIAETLAQMPTKALGMTKRLLNQSMSNSLQSQLGIESKLQIEAAQSEDYAEGVAAFVEKRRPDFKGK
jgi:2-(1,2-epoxy-1,2-dihydrophenyl)acetyl-CoA isomerase